MNTKKIKIRWVEWFSLSMIASSIVAQDANENFFNDDDIYNLSPFVVEENSDEGYMATATLAGTRVRTDLSDLASSISVVTEDFLEDTGATSNEQLLLYTTGTEVGGLSGNYAGVGNGQGAGEGLNLTQPNSNTRVRGLDAADNTRNYFLTDIPWDSYNVDRVDLQRGPNSILFGVGSPAGIINASTVVPYFENKGSIETRVGSYGSYRVSLDVNHIIIDDELAVRLTGLSEHNKYQQKPAFEKDRRGYLAISYDPKWFGKSTNTKISANLEHGEIRSNRPRILPPVDLVTPWWTGMNQQTYNSDWAWLNGALINGSGGNASLNPEINEGWLGNEMKGFMHDGLVFIYDNGQSVPRTVRQATGGLYYGRDANGGIDRDISSIQGARMLSIAGFNEYTRNMDIIADALGVESPYPSASKNFYKDKYLRDSGVFNFYDNLIDGDNKREWSDWEAFNISISQTYFRNRLGWEFVYDYQDYEGGAYNILGDRVLLGIDINTHRSLIPATYPNALPDVVPDPTTVQGGDLNPDVGRAYVSNARTDSGTDRTERTNLRFTVFGEFYGSDFFRDDSLFARLIGRNVITGLVNKDERYSESRRWKNFASDLGYSQHIGSGNTSITTWTRGVNYAVYLSDNLSGVSDPSNLNLSRLTTVVNPFGEYNATYFDSNWNADVSFGDPYTLPLNGKPSTQSENWQNYVGLSQMPVKIYNAAKDDLDGLMASVLKTEEVLDSYALTWQAYWWDGMIVPTFGWRHDELETWGSSADPDPVTGVCTTDFQNQKMNTFRSSGENITWGVVVHSEQLFKEPLIGDTHFSLFYNSSENFKPSNRYGYSGNKLPSPSGQSKDYGFLINTFDNKLGVKVTWYSTKLENAGIEGSPLGDSSWFLNSIEAWGTVMALKNELYWNGQLPGESWYCNYGLNDENRWSEEGWENAPFSEEALNHPSNQKLFAAINDWYATMPPQSFFDAYGWPINRAAAQSSSLEERIKAVHNGNWDPYGDIFANTTSVYSGSINGIYPTGTINQESEGMEIEVFFRPTNSWNITMNVAKTESTRTDLGNDITEFIEFQYNRFQGPAGDMRLWSGSDSTIREYYQRWIYAPYQFQLDSNGQQAPEVRPWRFNIISDYTFTEGVFKNLNLGIAYRWQDEIILGYALSDDQTKLDVDRPIHGASEDNIDLWIGYKRDLSDKISWDVQLNLRNVGEDAHLLPVSVNPDGEWATVRIVEGFSWELRNTFHF